jgi:hypothetical protein
MKTIARKNHRLASLSALALAAALLIAVTATAGERDGGAGRKDHGIIIGFNAGFGGSLFEYQDGSRNVTEDPTGGAMGALRLGYAFNRKIELSAEIQGFGGTGDEEDAWGVGAGFLALTWRPFDHGFFVRGGGGVGSGDYIHPDSGEKIRIDDRLAWLFSIGYDWRLSEGFSLGVSADAFGLDAGGSTGFDEDHVGAGGLTAQFTWRL